MHSEKQDELIRRYCADAEKLLDGVEDRTAALRLKNHLCDQFREECTSSLVAKAVSTYLEGVIEKRWRG